LARVIAIFSSKGGVGKTTTAVNLGASFAVGEYRTLIVDLVTDGGVAFAFGQGQRRLPGTGQMGELPSGQLLQKTQLDNLDLLHSDLYGTSEEERFNQRLLSDRDLIRNFLNEIRDQYRFILLDCPASLGTIAYGALGAADSVLVPVQCEPHSLKAVSAVIKAVRNYNRQTGRDLGFEGFLLTMYDLRTNLSDIIYYDARSILGNLLLSTIIPRNVRLAEVFIRGKPAVLLDVGCAGSRAYLRLAQEILVKNGMAEEVGEGSLREG
jgi:chromosome partitioning protein